MWGNGKLKLREFGLNLVIRLVFLGYALLMISPALPVLKDRLAHSFYHSYHIAVVHAHNGEEHVHYEQKKLVQDSKSTKAPIKQKSETQDFFAYQVEKTGIKHPESYIENFKTHQFFYTDEMLSVFTAQLLRPPCC